MKFAVVPNLEGEGPFYLWANYIGLRPLTGGDPYFLLAFFESPIGETYLCSLLKVLITKSQCEGRTRYPFTVIKRGRNISYRA